MSDKKNDAASALEQVALKRREEVNVKAKKPLPGYIRTIESTSVSYTVDPDILPFALVDPAALVTLMHERFHLNFRQPKYDAQLLANLGLDTSQMTQAGILNFLLRGPQPMVAFDNGRYPTGPNSFVLIEGVEIGREAIGVRVKSITDVAEIVAADAFSIFWEAAGGSARWDSKATQENVQGVGYKTVTKVHLGCSAEMLVNSSVAEWFDKRIAEIGPAMLMYSAYDSFQPTPKAVASWSFDQLVIKVHVFDPPTGRAETATVDIDTVALTDRGHGVVQLTTELPFDRHIELAEAIRAALGGTTQPA